MSISMVIEEKSIAWNHNEDVHLNHCEALRVVSLSQGFPDFCYHCFIN